MNRRLALIAALVAALMLPGSAFAVGATVTVSDNQFSNNNPTILFGDVVDWSWSGTNNDHTATSTGLNLNPFNIALPEGSGSSTGVNFGRAGAFAYRCNFHGNMRGTVMVQMMASDTTPGVNQQITITFATAGAPSGYTQVIQKRKAGGTWRLFMKSTGTSVNFTPPKVKTFEFRSRLKNINTGAVTGWSPVLQVTVVN